MRIGAILSGGQSRRMGGVDKATLTFNGERLIDRIYRKFSDQVDIVVVSGAHDYGLGIPAIPDMNAVFGGPVLGVMSVFRWMMANYQEADGFVTAPVDGPFLPDDLATRLYGYRSAYAVDDEGVHPTFAFWTRKSIDAAAAHLKENSSLSLKGLVNLTGARPVHWKGNKYFANINRPEDLERWTDKT